MLNGEHHFENDFLNNKQKIKSIIKDSSFLVLGGAGSIGQEVVKIIFSFSPSKLHVIDISENNLVELVRDIRSSFGYIKGDFEVFSLDIGTTEYDKFIEQDGRYDFVLNLSALKHVRSEKDPFTLIRLIKTNILNVEKSINQSIEKGSKNYFCVSTDKAANPVNLMGASKRIMELFLFNKSDKIKVSSARFANVLFSDGSLLHSFKQRLIKKQPIVAPLDIKRYFISNRDAAILCILSCLTSENREIYFPKLNPERDLMSFDVLAISFLKEQGLKPLFCKSEEEARLKSKNISNSDYWPCFFSDSETTGEKPIEEFYSEKEKYTFEKFHKIGVIENRNTLDYSKLLKFKNDIEQFQMKKVWLRNDLIQIFNNLLEEFKHIEKNKFLNQKM